MGRSGAVQRRSETIRSTHRQAEHEWIRTHLEVLRQLAGQWVVLEGERIVAHGKNVVRVANSARRKGIAVPYVFYVEAPDEEPTVYLGM
jgi:hypothetical protein